MNEEVLVAQTLVQKIIARASGQSHVAPGAMVSCKIDLVMAHDGSGPQRWASQLKELNAEVWDTSKIVLITDHYVPPADQESAAILKLTRDFAKAHGIYQFHDMQGICHVVLPEYGYLKPGMFACGGDSHSPTGGAFGCYMAGYGWTDIAAMVITGDTWTIVPETIRVNLSGGFAECVAAKDVMLLLCRELGMDNSFKVVEYGGGLVADLSVQERMVLTNMAAELGCETGIIEADQKTLDHIRAHGGHVDDDALEWRSDRDAPYEAVHDFHISTLEPQVAAPHSPSNSGPVSAHVGQRIDQCYIGACTGAKLEDLHMAARILKGRQVSPETRLLVAPASALTTKHAVADGTLQILLEAGVVMLPTGCGACAGLGAGVLAAGEVCMSSTNRNFKGRMGHKDSDVYLGSPYTVAATAVAGRIADPREILADAPAHPQGAVS